MHPRAPFSLDVFPGSSLNGKDPFYRGSTLSLPPATHPAPPRPNPWLGSFSAVSTNTGNAWWTRTALIVATNGPVGGLTAAQVMQIMNSAVATANLTRAQIRLPIGARAKMTIAVSDLDGTLIGLYRMTDGTVFSIDVAATKARNVIYFSGMNRQAADLNQVPLGTAVTNRTIGFGAQPFFPSGIDGTPPGPFFNLYTQDTGNACTQGFQAPSAAWPKMNQSGVVFFPGSEPLYINGVLVGGLGVSGDGVDQDDYVTAGGAAGFEAPADIRADQIVIDGVRLPFLKFPRNPTD